MKALVALLMVLANVAWADPVLVLGDSVVEATAGAATVRVKAPPSARTGDKFWVRVGTEITDADVRILSGALFYDSLLVRPTGRLLDNGEVSVGFLGNTPRPGECATAPSGTNTAIRDISWSSARGQPVGHLAKVQFGVEFMALVAGSADFGWTPKQPDCTEATVVDGAFARKVTDVIWSVEDDSLGTLYYTSAAEDTANYNTVNAITTITGTSVTAAKLWPNNPGNYESYVRFTPDTLDVTAPATAKVAVEVWLPYPIAPADSLGLTVVYERNKMTLSRAEGRNGWSVSPPRDDLSDYTDYVVASTVDTTFTSICGVDSAAARILWLHPREQHLQPKGQVMELQFTVTRVGGVAKLGCWFADVPGAINASNFPPVDVYMSAKDRSRRNYPLIENELAPYVWKWRRATSATFVVE